MKQKEVEELIIIEPGDTESILALINYLKDKEFVAYDTETTGLNKSDRIIGYSVCAESNKAYYVTLAAWDKEQQKLIFNEDEAFTSSSIALLNFLKTRKLIMHNGIFDCWMTDNNFKVSLIDSLHTDTMILAHLVNENRKVGLKELGKFYFGDNAMDEQAEMKASILANGGQCTKSNYELYKADSPLIGKYGAKDAIITFKIYQELRLELAKEGLEKFFYEDESMPLLRGPTYQLNTTGLRVDVSALNTLKKTLIAECLEAKEFIRLETLEHVKEKYPGTSKTKTFNFNSNQQLSWLLFGKLSLEFGTLTKEGKVVCKALGLKVPYAPGAKREFIARCQSSVGMEYAPAGTSLKTGKKTRPKKLKEPWVYIACDAKVLSKLAPRFKWIQKLLQHNKNKKILNTYVEGIEDRMQYGVIRPTFLQHGTSSGRYSSRNPNFQNLPRDDKRVKSCIIPRPGKAFVGADYSQLEPRVFAYFSNDTKLLEAFKTGDDFYSTIGIAVYAKYDCTASKEDAPDSFKVKYKALRDPIKKFALAAVYGANAWKLSSLTGKSVEATQEDLDAYFEQFPGVPKFMKDSHKLAKKYGYVTNIFGRKRRIPDATKIDRLYGKNPEKLPYEAQKLLNLSVNHRIQSTGASIVNRAAIAFNQAAQDAEIDCQLVLQVHDSFTIECDEKDAKDVAILLQWAMEETTQLETIALEAIPKIGFNLSEV